MRQITRDAAQAWLNNKSWRRNNTQVRHVHDNHSVVELHGHPIAWWTKTGVHTLLTFTLAGYQTRTTCERVNGLMREAGISARIYQRDFQMYINHLGKTLAFGPDAKLVFFTDTDKCLEELEIV